MLWVTQAAFNAKTHNINAHHVPKRTISSSHLAPFIFSQVLRRSRSDFSAFRDSKILTLAQMDDDYFDLKYADNELLPKDKPVGYPHVIQDLHDETDPTDLCLADGVATILYNLNVEILEVFLDVNGPSVELYCNRKYAHHIFMNRHDNIVEVCCLHHECTWQLLTTW